MKCDVFLMHHRAMSMSLCHERNDMRNVMLAVLKLDIHMYLQIDEKSIRQK
jgi:hypothetical protein